MTDTTGLAFAVVDDDIDSSGIDFYGVSVAVVGGVGGSAVAYVPGAQPPASDREVVLRFHEVVERLAERGACLPHRFGTIVDLSAAVRDLGDNVELLTSARSTVRNRREMLVRARVVPTRAVAQLGSELAGLATESDPIEIGRAVHARIPSLLTGLAADALAGYEASDIDGFADIHRDGLGADVVLLIRPDDDPDHESHLAPLLDCCELERFDPTPCYRYAGRLLTQLSAPAP